MTNTDGSYQALQLIPGVYRVKASHAGYSTSVQDNVTVDVQTRAQVDITLTVGSVSQQVEINSSSQLLQTQSAEVSGVLNTQEINDLPLNGRDYDQLALTQPGVFRDNTVSNPGGGAFQRKWEPATAELLSTRWHRQQLQIGESAGAVNPVSHSAPRRTAGICSADKNILCGVWHIGRCES